MDDKLIIFSTTQGLRNTSPSVQIMLEELKTIFSDSKEESDELTQRS